MVANNSTNIYYFGKIHTKRFTDSCLSVRNKLVRSHCHAFDHRNHNYLEEGHDAGK